MTKLVLIEIDKTVADISKREQRARSHTEARVREMGARAGDERGHSEYMNILYSQEALYNPDLVSLDTLIQGVTDSLAQLQQAGYCIAIRTCRPHWMESATTTWLKRYAIAYHQLQCKNFADRTERYTSHELGWAPTPTGGSAHRQQDILLAQGEQRLRTDRPKKSTHPAPPLDGGTRTALHGSLEPCCGPAAPLWELRARGARRRAYVRPRPLPGTLL